MKPESGGYGSERVARLETRLRVLGDVARAFAEPATDSQRVFDTVVRGIAKGSNACATLLLFSADGASLSLGAVFDRDPETVQRTRAAFDRPLRLRDHPMLARVLEGGEALLAPTLARSSLGQGDLELARLAGMLGLMVLPLHSGGRPVGALVLSRSGEDAEPLCEEDLELGRDLADSAAVAVAGAQARSIDVEARKTIDRSTQLYRSLFDDSPSPTYVFDAETLRILAANDAALKLYGYSRSEFLALRLDDLRHPDDRASFRPPSSSREHVTGGGRHRRKDGTAIYVEGKNRLATFEGRPARIAVLSPLGGFLEASPDAMIVVDAAGMMVLVNEQAVELFGYMREELVDKPVEILVPRPSRATHPAHRTAYAENASIRTMGSGLVLSGLRKDGTEVPVEISLSPLQTADGVLVVTAIRDVSERRRADAARFHLAAIADASAEAIIGKTLDGVITTWNHGAERIFGYAAAEMVGKSSSILMPSGRQNEEQEILEKVRRGENVRLETVRRKKSGSEIHVLATTSPIRDMAGNILGAAKVASDITDLVNARNAATAASKELEAFSYSVAHDLRAPLRGMSGFSRLLLDTYADKLDAEGQDWLEEIQRSAQKMAQLIDALLSLARLTRSELHREPVSLSALVRQSFERLAASEPSRVVDLAIEDSLRADADPLLAKALVDNLMENAWKFTSRRPDARIDFGMLRTNGADVFFVRDNGAGFDPSFAGKLFAPFQRLHTVAEFPGTGVGLATAQRIVNRHGGRIWAEAAVDAGATFFFSFASPRTGGPP